MCLLKLVIVRYMVNFKFVDQPTLYACTKTEKQNDNDPCLTAEDVKMYISMQAVRTLF